MGLELSRVSQQRPEAGRIRLGNLQRNTAVGWVILNGNRIQIKRKRFENIIDILDAI